MVKEEETATSSTETASEQPAALEHENERERATNRELGDADIVTSTDTDGNLLTDGDEMHIGCE
jgi:uncharacterized Zn ribbon protein